MQHRDASTPYTFPNMDFSPDAGGIRVGPWCGWRGIPPMPRMSLRAGAREIHGRFDFWGDEEATGLLRCTFECEQIGSSEIVLTVGDERIVPSNACVYPMEMHRAQPMEISLSPMHFDKHPRLLFSEVDLPSLRGKAISTHASFWKRIIPLFDQWELPFEKTPESKLADGPERLSPEDRLLLSSLRALIEPNAGTVAQARAELLAYLALTKQDDFEPLKIDTQCGETLFCFSLAYDWCHPFLDEETKRLAKQRLYEIADICWAHLGYERHDYAQAHFLGCGMGLLAFSFVFWEEHPRAQEWASYLRGCFERAMHMLPEDGFFPHGMNLWIYEHSFLLRWLELLRHCAGEDLWQRTAYWKAASHFRAATLSMDGRYGITFGDPQFRVGGDSWQHDLVAARTSSPEAQWLANRLRDEEVSGVDFRNAPARRRVYEFLFHDERVAPVKREEHVQIFSDGGQIVLRSEGEHSSLFTFRSGYPLGSRRYEAGERGGYGHSDPMHGAFLFLRNERFITSGSGPVYRRDTSLNNTITIDGKGQLGDGCVWIPDFIPPEHINPAPIVRVHDKAISIFAELTNSYLPHLHVRSCTRSMLVDLSRYILGVDCIDLESTRQIEWNYHSWLPMRFSQRERYWEILFQDTDDVRLKLLSPYDCQIETGRTPFVPAYPHDGKRDYFLRASMRARTTMFIWCIALHPSVSPQLVPTQEREPRIRLSIETIAHFDGAWLTIE